MSERLKKVIHSVETFTPYKLASFYLNTYIPLTGKHKIINKITPKTLLTLYYLFDSRVMSKTELDKLIIPLNNGTLRPAEDV